MNRMQVFAAALILVSCSCLGARENDGPDAVDKKWEAAMRAGDVDAVMACYAPDAIAWLPDSAPANSTEAIRAIFTGILQANNVTAVELMNTHVHTCGDMAVKWGEYTLTLTPKAGGKPKTETGRYTEALKKQGGKWVYAVDHASANPSSTPKG
jgi:uncharacterized protein (TIGR02246 family)